MDSWLLPTNMQSPSMVTGMNAPVIVGGH